MTAWRTGPAGQPSGCRPPMSAAWPKPRLRASRASGSCGRPPAPRSCGTRATSCCTRLGYAEPAYLAGLLTGTARAVERARRHQSVSVVWTGPESGVSSSRLTAAAVIELINAARSEILLVSYATHTEPSISTALSAAVARGVAVTLLAERHEDNPSYTALGTPFPGLDALRLHWPAQSRPPGAALHAKIIVVDDQVALVGSANLTSRAMESNLECGILIRGGPQPRAIRDHITGLYAAGLLLRL